MGLLSDFFVADVSEVGGVAARAPAGRFPTVESKSVDDVMLATLTGIATGRDFKPEEAFAQLLEEVGDPVDEASEEEGPWVWRVPDALLTTLASASGSELGQIAREWAATEEWSAHNAEADDLRELLAEVAELARHAQRADKSVFLWLSL